VIDLLKALRRHGLEGATHDREALEQLGEMLGTQREQAAVRGSHDYDYCSNGDDDNEDNDNNDNNCYYKTGCNTWSPGLLL